MASNRALRSTTALLMVDEDPAFIVLVAPLCQQAHGGSDQAPRVRRDHLDVGVPLSLVFDGLFLVGEIPGEQLVCGAAGQPQIDAVRHAVREFRLRRRSSPRCR